jgi:hypothetical protein
MLGELPRLSAQAAAMYHPPSGTVYLHGGFLTSNDGQASGESVRVPSPLVPTHHTNPCTKKMYYVSIEFISENRGERFADSFAAAYCATQQISASFSLGCRNAFLHRIFVNYLLRFGVFAFWGQKQLCVYLFGLWLILSLLSLQHESSCISPTDDVETQTRHIG